MTRPRLARLSLSLSLAALVSPALAQTQIVMWGDWTGDGEKQINTMVSAFNAAQKDVVVKYVPQQDIITKFLTAATAGQVPDVIIWDRFRTALYAPKNVLAPIDSYIARDKINRGDFYAEALKELSYGGKTYGLPLTVDARAIFYNKTLFQQAGLKPPTTWAELEAAAVKLTQRDASGKLTRTGFLMNDPGLFNMYLQQAGGSMLSADGSKTAFNSAAGIQVLDFWNRMINTDKVYELGFGSGEANAQDPFVTGKAAMIYTGPWSIDGYRKYGKDLNFGIVPPPAGPGGARGSVMGGFGLAIPQGSRSKDAAWTFIKWWLNDPKNALLWAKTSNNIPGNLKAVNDPYFQNDPFWKAITDTLKFAKVRPGVPGYPPMEGNALVPNVQLFLEGKQDAKTTLDKAQQAGDRILKDNANP